MTLYASSQQVASNPAAFQIGVPTQNLLDGYTSSAQATTDLTVGSGCFYVDINGVDTTVKQTNSGTNPFAGIVVRSNANAMPFSQSLPGFSATIPAGTSNALILSRGSIPVNIAIANESGSVPLVGSQVVAMADGTFQTQINPYYTHIHDAGTYAAPGTAGPVTGSSGAPTVQLPSGGVLTNFRVRQVPSGWTTGGLVVITNTQNAGA